MTGSNHGYAVVRYMLVFSIGYSAECTSLRESESFLAMNRSCDWKSSDDGEHERDEPRVLQHLGMLDRPLGRRQTHRPTTLVENEEMIGRIEAPGNSYSACSFFSKASLPITRMKVTIPIEKSMTLVDIDVTISKFSLLKKRAVLR